MSGSPLLNEKKNARIYTRKPPNTQAKNGSAMLNGTIEAAN